MTTPEWITQLPPEMAVIMLAALPIFELRGSIPLAIAVFKLPIPLAVFWSLVGNMIPVFLVYGLGNHWLKLCARHRGWWQRLTDWTLERSQRKLRDKYRRWGLWALALFVAIPLPVTGAWTGSLAAFVFGIKRRQAWPFILLGLMIAAAVVTLATTGVIAGAGLFTK